MRPWLVPCVRLSSLNRRDHPECWALAYPPWIEESRGEQASRRDLNPNTLAAEAVAQASRWCGTGCGGKPREGPGGCRCRSRREQGVPVTALELEPGSFSSQPRAPFPARTAVLLWRNRVWKARGGSCAQGWLRWAGGFHPLQQVGPWGSEGSKVRVQEEGVCTQMEERADKVP